MTENPDEIVTLKVRRGDWNWVKNIQGKLRNTEGRESSHAQIFQRIRAVYENASDSPGNELSGTVVRQNAQGILLDFDIRSEFDQIQGKLDKLIKATFGETLHNPASGNDSTTGVDRLSDAEAEAERLANKFLQAPGRVRRTKDKHPKPATGRGND